jgi:apolipoprotein N-acyltransferase
MQAVGSRPSRAKPQHRQRSSQLISAIRSALPSVTECGAAVSSAALLVFAFPNFDLWPLAWVGLIPLLLIVSREPQPRRAFMTGWLFGTIFFYGSCYWLTYSMIHFGRISTWLAFAMLIPGAIVLGLFPAIFALTLAHFSRKWGGVALAIAPFFWVALEWARLEITGQLWNAIGYSQAYHPQLIATARWGGVYAVGFLILTINAAIAFAILNRNWRTGLAAAGVVLVLVILFIGQPRMLDGSVAGQTDAIVVALQPNVPMDLVKSTNDLLMLNDRHFQMSEAALRSLKQDGKPRLVIWPESPMNFTYGTDSQLRERIAAFARLHKTSLLLNSQELAPNDGLYNSALLINEDGKLVAQYDKIRLLPFGEYVPLPRWLPGAGLITAIVGDFTAGASYRQMQVGPVKTGVFICVESAYPSIARRFTREGADVLVNISNDGYLGPTAVMRQHLANAVFRSVENGRPILRVTNTGITGYITPAGEVRDTTAAFQTDVRIWGISRTGSRQTFYARYGDAFVALCSAVSLLALAFSFKRRRTRGY